MKQIVQSYKTGEVKLREVPVPICGEKRVIVKNSNSLVSIGTERLMIDLGRKSLAGKALERPDLVRRAWDKAKKEGKSWTYSPLANARFQCSKESGARSRKEAQRQTLPLRLIGRT